MKRFDVSETIENQLDKVFSYLRNKKEGDPVRILDEDGSMRFVCFKRRGQKQLSVFDRETHKPKLVAFDKVVPD